MRLSLSSASPNTQPRKGIALVEVIVAMVLLAIAVTSLAAMVGSVSKSSMRTTGDAYKNGVLMSEVNRLEGLPYDSIPSPAVTSYSVSTGPYAHTRVVTVSEPVVNIKTIKVVITPTNSKFKPDTVSFTRTRARTSKVLCKTCQ